MKASYIFFLILALFAPSAVASNDSIRVSNLKVHQVADKCNVNMQIDWNGLQLRRNQQLFITPILTDGTQNAILPTYVLSGRSMHYVYLRSGKTKASGKTNYKIAREYYYKQDKGMQSADYDEAVTVEPWMSGKDAHVVVNIDTCGCGRLRGNDALASMPLGLPRRNARVQVPPFPLPVDEYDVIRRHEGKARFMFEVSKYALHSERYEYTHSVTGVKHVIDNRSQLKLIDDSIRYALSEPNVELVGIDICGYASPESPYENNENLAVNRARAVAEYIQKHYDLPKGISTSTAVPENWKGFREQVVNAKDITEQQRRDLLTLIDRPIKSYVDYDRKETELTTSPKFQSLYNAKIRPLWFPELRYTQFTISTHLKPLTLEQLRKQIVTDPTMMSLSKIYRVARSYEHGSEGFCNAIMTAVRVYPDNPSANLNAASLAIEQDNYELARKYADKAGDSEEAKIVRKILDDLGE